MGIIERWFPSFFPSLVKQIDLYIHINSILLSRSYSYSFHTHTLHSLTLDLMSVPPAFLLLLFVNTLQIVCYLIFFFWVFPLVVSLPFTDPREPLPHMPILSTSPYVLCWWSLRLPRVNLGNLWVGYAKVFTKGLILKKYMSQSTSICSKAKASYVSPLCWGRPLTMKLWANWRRLDDVKPWTVNKMKMWVNWLVDMNTWATRW